MYWQDIDPFAETRRKRIAERESDYQARRHQAVISPERADPFADGKSRNSFFGKNNLGVQ